MGSHAQGDSNGTLAGVDANYGVGTNAQLHLIAPLAFDHPGDSGSRTGIGDIELGVKYRFVDPGPNDGWPQVAVYPLLEVPTGDADQGLGNSHVRAFLPVWLQKDLGEWKTYGGGGLWINPGTNNHNYWFFGWLLQRQFTDRLAVGGELFHQTADADDGKDTSGFNVGAIYDLTDHYHVLCSGGRGVQNAAQTNEFSYYVAVQWTFGPHASGRFPGVVQDI